MLAMDMDRIFDSASITSTNQEEDIETGQAASNETTSLSPVAASRPRKKTQVRKSRCMTITEKGTKDTDSSTSMVSLSQNDFLSSSGTVKHQRQHCTRKNENMVDKATSQGTDNTTKENQYIAQTNGPTRCTTNPLPRSKFMKPTSVLNMNMSDKQGLTPAASSFRAVPPPKQDYSQKKRKATGKSAKDSSMWAASSGKIQSTVFATPQDNHSIKKSNEILILEEVDSTEQITSSSGTMTQSPNISPRQQKHAKDVIVGKKIDDNLQDTKGVVSIGSKASSASAGSRLRKNHFTRQLKETDEANLDEIINEIMEIPALDTGASANNLCNVGTSSRKKNSSTQPNKSKATDKMINLDEAIDEILETLDIPTLEGGSKQAVSKARKTNSREKPTAQTISVPKIGFLSEVKTMNCDSGCSVASGDNMRPMAAGSSTHITRQQPTKAPGKQTVPAILIKEENTERKPRMRASRKTAEPSLRGLKGKATHRNAAVPVTSGKSTRLTSPGIFYESGELELMKQIEKDSRCC